MSAEHRGPDLRGSSLRGQDLEGASYRGADLRGADLEGANLSRADLRGARTGMSARWTWIVVSIALLVSVACGVAAAYAGRILARALESEQLATRATGTFVAVALAVFLVVTDLRGLRPAVRIVLPVAATVVVLGAVLAVARGVGTGEAAALGLAFLAVVALVVVLAIGARALAGAGGSATFMLVAFSGAAAGALLGGGIIAALIAIAALLAGQRALHGPESYPMLEQTLARIAARGGTNLRGADLRGARLEDARLFATDLRGARLEGAKLEGARLRLSLFDGERPIVPRRPRTRRRRGAAARA